jgi:hypothetical protein
MKTMLFGGLAIMCLTACTVNSNRPTSWGKEGVSMLDYQTDNVLCQTLAERADADNNANTAGGINGANGQARPGNGGDSAAAGGAAGAGSGSSTQTIGGGGSYRDSASPDLVARAANQQRAREMQLKQARMDTLRSCLVGRGYTEFDLSTEQRAKLASLPQGSKERQQYLYSLGTDPANLKKGAASAK